MSALSDSFVVLSASSVVPGPSQFKTGQATGMPEGYLIGVGGDSARHLLFPLGTAALHEDRRSPHLVLVEQDLTMPDGRVEVFADLRCDDPELFGVFGFVLDDVSSRLSGSGRDSVQVCRDVLSDWRELISPGRSALDRAAETGLFGELTVLGLLGVGDPVAALEAWKGPDDASWDFQLGARAVEVKTTASVSATSVTVSNIEQLDPQGLQSLDLVVVHVREAADGQSLDDIIDSLVDSGFDSRDLVAKAAKVGHLYGQGVSRRLTEIGIRRWEVSQEFPSLRRSEIPKPKVHALRKVMYELALPSGAHELSDQGEVAWFGDWVRS